jgi:RNA polymerase sigma-70 factor (ECF subfamily)
MEQRLYQEFMDCQDKLYRYALFLSREVADAEDILQETLIKLWELKAKWGKWQSLEGYAMRMIKNAYINFNIKRRRNTLVELDEIPERSSRTEMDRKIEVSHLMFHFKSLIDTLPSIQRDILYLREIEEYEYKEIAAILNITESQVKVYLHRGRQSLRTKTNANGRD